VQIYLNEIIKKFKIYIYNERQKDRGAEHEALKVGEIVAYLPANFTKVQNYMDVIKDSQKKLDLLIQQDQVF
tara:strand:- start:1415 stop:1630 length:216 start_codon:yes stop_codon:yes gene_type:complete